MKNKEYIHLTEKIRLEEVIQNLTKQNNELKKSLDDSHVEIKNLTMQIEIMRMELNKFKTKHRLSDHNTE